MSLEVARFYVGLDLGTSGCRGLVISGQGWQVAAAETPWPAPKRGSDGTSEQNPRLWWDAVQKVLGELSRSLPTSWQGALAVAGTSATLMLVADDGTPCSPALMYDDSRSRREAEALRRIAPPDSGAQGPSSSLAKALYLSTRHPGLRKDRHLLHQADWIAGKLCGRFGLSDENNALKLGYDVVARRWPPWLSQIPGLPLSWLPEVVPPGRLLGSISPAVAQRTGLPPGLRVVAGTTDSTAACLAAGVSDHGDAVTSLGSTLVLKILSPEPLFAPVYGIYSHRIRGQWLVGGASNSGGAVCTRFFTETQIAEMTPRLNPDIPTGLDYYPLLARGERFPRNDPDLEPRLSPRPDDDLLFFQAILEGVATIERDGYRLLSSLGTPAARVVQTLGGGSRNAAWLRIRERLLDVPVKVAHHQQAAYGAAVLARDGEG